MKKISTYEMAICGIFSALMCIMGPVSIPIGPIPVTPMIFIIFVAVIVCGTKIALISYLIYLLIGALGLPVFSGYAGGLGKLTGPTGGYLTGFIFTILISGMIYEKFYRNIVITFTGMVLGLIAAYTFGTIYFMVLMKVDVVYALTVCVIPFIPIDIIKIALAIPVGKAVKIRVIKVGGGLRLNT